MIAYIYHANNDDGINSCYDIVVIVISSIDILELLQPEILPGPCRSLQDLLAAYGQFSKSHVCFLRPRPWQFEI